MPEPVPCPALEEQCRSLSAPSPARLPVLPAWEFPFSLEPSAAAGGHGAGTLFSSPGSSRAAGCRLETATGNLGVIIWDLPPPKSFIFCPSELKRDKNKLVSAKTSSLSIVCSQVSSARMFGNAGGHHGLVPRLPTRVGIGELMESHGEEPVLWSWAGGSSR